MTKEIPNDVSPANKDSALDSLLSQVESGVLPEVPIGLRGAVAAAVANSPVEMDAAWAERLGGDISLEEEQKVIEVIPQFPDTYEPKRTFRWVFESPGLDIFLIKKVTLPKITFENDKMKAASLMEVEVYDAIAPNGSEQVLRMAQAASSPGGAITKIKLIDANGTVVSMWEFRVKLAHVEHPVLDYAVNELLVLKVFLEVAEMKLVW